MTSAPKGTPSVGSIFEVPVVPVWRSAFYQDYTGGGGKTEGPSPKSVS